MIIDLHTPKGVVQIDTATVSDAELAKLNLRRENLPVDWRAEWKKATTQLEKVSVVARYLGLE